MSISLSKGNDVLLEARVRRIGTTTRIQVKSPRLEAYFREQSTVPSSDQPALFVHHFDGRMGGLLMYQAAQEVLRRGLGTSHPFGTFDADYPQSSVFNMAYLGAVGLGDGLTIDVVGMTSVDLVRAWLEKLQDTAKQVYRTKMITLDMAVSVWTKEASNV
jgi:hypothetical protein